MGDKRKYKVTGIHPVLDKEPGSVFEAELSEQQERMLVESGALKRVGEQKKASASEKSRG